MSGTAVVLFNLGGPDGPQAVRPYLFNLFNDPAILNVPGPLRWLLAGFISWRRAPVTRRIFSELGGRSPLLENTEAQAAALENMFSGRAVGSNGGRAPAASGEVKVFIAMRHWHPMSEEAAGAVKAYDPARVVLLPLYPQFSTATTGSSIAAWGLAAARVGLSAPTTAVCCYPTGNGLVGEIAARLRAAIAESRAQGAGGPAQGRPRVLFSAHGLPKRIVARGDPYQWQVEQTAAAIVDSLGDAELDWRVCYTSRVGPLEWIGPSLDTEIERAGRGRVPLVVVPIAFVSEHSETLVELDIEYRRRARDAGVPSYTRVPTAATGAAFIAGLADLVDTVLADGRPLCSQAGGRLCPAGLSGCPLAAH